MTGTPDVQPGLEALRSGRFEEARAWFDRIAVEEPEAPEGPFFQAFHTWWKLLDEPPDAGSLRQSMEDYLKESTRRAEGLESSSDETIRERALVFSGVSMLLQAESMASRGIRFRAGSTARRGHKRLMRALELMPESPDAFFALGAYDYYADKLPTIVKGIKFLLFIPGGDSDRGIARLEISAQRSRLFGTEALMLLSHIYASKHEANYRRAMEYNRRAIARHPSSPLINLAHADLLFNMGRFDASVDHARTALRTMIASQGYSREMVHIARYRLAACAIEMQDPIKALNSIESIIEVSIPTTESESPQWLDLLLRAARQTGQPDRVNRWLTQLSLSPSTAAQWRHEVASIPHDEVASERARALGALASGKIEDAKSQIARLIAQYPVDPRLQYDMGRLLQIEGQLEEADPFLEKTAAGPPSDLAGWATIRLAWGLEQRGDRARAIPLYRRAAKMRRFSFRAGAQDRLAYPAVDPPEG